MTHPSVEYQERKMVSLVFNIQIFYIGSIIKNYKRNVLKTTKLKSQQQSIFIEPYYGFKNFKKVQLKDLLLAWFQDVNISRERLHQKIFKNFLNTFFF